MLLDWCEPADRPGDISTTFGRITDEFDAQIPVGQLVKRDPGDWNYLQRALRIKPEVKIIVMSHARPVARSILCSILVTEGSSGIVDLVRDSENAFSFTGRVEKDNSKSLRASRRMETDVRLHQNGV